MAGTIQGSIEPMGMSVEPSQIFLNIDPSIASNSYRQIDGVALGKIFGEKIQTKNDLRLEGLIMKVLTICKDKLLKPLTQLINFSILTGTCPDRCKVAKVMASKKPRYKKGDESEMCYYRPVSLLPVVSKLIEKVACDQCDCLSGGE